MQGLSIPDFLLGFRLNIYRKTAMIHPNITTLKGDCSSIQNRRQDQPIVLDLEAGQVIYCPDLHFTLLAEEFELLDESLIQNSRKKNISYLISQKKLGGLADNHPKTALFQSMMHRYAEFAKTLVETLVPDYQAALIWGRTSFRPAEIAGRKRSKRQDDTRIHVDAFPSTPVHGKRILRVFCNINPNNKARIWHLGQPFDKVLEQFIDHLPPYRAHYAQLLKALKITKSLREPYDHYMLSLHDKMKQDDDYQNHLNKEDIAFPAQSTWMVFTDQVSHAALSGQHLLEQTFYLPVEAMNQPDRSPYKLLKSAHPLIKKFV